MAGHVTKRMNDFVRWGEFVLSGPVPEHTPLIPAKSLNFVHTQAHFKSSTTFSRPPPTKVKMRCYTERWCSTRVFWSYMVQVHLFGALTANEMQLWVDIPILPAACIIRIMCGKVGAAATQNIISRSVHLQLRENDR